jgi:hypothetical protein
MDTWDCSSEIYDAIFKYIKEGNIDRVTLVSIIEETIRKHIANY